jgi:hypothetical protein
VLSDIYAAADKQCLSLLGLLDLSAAFHCVDHAILINRLPKVFGINDTALKWITSFLSDRSQQISYSGRLSATVSLLFGVPQGSVLGPLLYLLYTAELFEIISQCGMSAHCYADDTQVYTSTPAPSIQDAVERFRICVERIEHWLKGNRLKMNAEKTQVIWLGTRQQLAKVDIAEIQLLSTSVYISTTAVDLGFTLDSALTMSNHVAAVCRSCFFQLRQLRAVRKSLSSEATEILIHSFVSGRLDYCNSLLAGISDRLLQRLQSVQNAAAKLVMGLRKFDHVSGTLRQLHWLPVRHRITYKVALLVFKCLHGLAPVYLADDCQLTSTISNRRHLRSSSTGVLSAPRTRTSIGARSFAVIGPVTWNNLPLELRCLDSSVELFSKRLKTHLMSLCF